jgi:cholesterol transport system auxiliary component
VKGISNPSAVTGIAGLMLALALNGCSLGPGETNVSRTYLLSPDISSTTFSPNPGSSGAAILLVSSPKAQAGFDTPRMAYLLRPYELSYYAFNRWADTPSRMLTGLLAQTMERTGLWRAVVQAPSAVRAEYRLDSDNLALEQQFFSTGRVRVALRAQLVDVKRQHVVGTRDFEVFAPLSSADAYGGAIAANQAVGKLLAELAQWTAAIMHEEARAFR